MHEKPVNASCDRPAFVAQVIMEKVTRASGAFYSAHKDHLNQTTQTKQSVDAAPVVCAVDTRIPVFLPWFW